VGVVGDGRRARWRQVVEHRRRDAVEADGAGGGCGASRGRGWLRALGSWRPSVGESVGAPVGAGGGAAHAMEGDMVRWEWMDG
jgi:hypothetical protein